METASLFQLLQLNPNRKNLEDKYSEKELHYSGIKAIQYEC